MRGSRLLAPWTVLLGLVFCLGGSQTAEAGTVTIQYEIESGYGYFEVGRYYYPRQTPTGGMFTIRYQAQSATQVVDGPFTFLTLLASGPDSKFRPLLSRPFDDLFGSLSGTQAALLGDFRAESGPSLSHRSHFDVNHYESYLESLVGASFGSVFFHLDMQIFTYTDGDEDYKFASLRGHEVSRTFEGAVPEPGLGLLVATALAALGAAPWLARRCRRTAPR